MDSTLAVVGAGPGLAMGVARAFGRRGFRVGLIARTEQRLKERVAELADAGVTSAAFAADVRDPEALTGALDEMARQLGPVDVLEYGPDPRAGGITSAAVTAAESATAQFELIVRGALVAAQHVLPGMLERGGGALLLTTGASSAVPMPMLGNVGIAMAGLRNWAHAAAAELRPRGIYIGTITVATTVSDDSPDGAPDTIGELYHDMYTRRDRVEEVVGDLDRIRALAAAT
ncbi:SDR family NAD(P)-dependent oxidoreductase [Streptomyces sp. NPDC007851]|uniref:SDR family NAD(P)-dependent oxidoreductase n=1 Tax=Streptomyces sp. NPDC007851 TaxID=3155008 RepID=UPI0033F01F4D